MVQHIITPISMQPQAQLALANLSCVVPFNHIEIHSSGAVSACCYTWLPKWVGNLLIETAQEVLDNADRKRIQDNMRNSKFSNCNDQCPQLNSILSGKKDYWDIVPTDQLENKLKNSAIHIGFSYDHSCNLQCPSCRNNLIVWKPTDPNDIDGQRILKIHNQVKELIDILLDRGHRVNLNITGSGDAFASPLYWNYLLELASKPISKNLRIHLKTNGVMMTEENLNDIKPLWPIIGYVEVSVDAATEVAYKIVRKNGNFKKLKQNLEVFDRLRLAGCFPKMYHWQTNFIVQKDNYRELIEFIKWQLTFKSKPVIWTNLLAQWHHINNEQFADMAVWQSSHAEHKDFVEILKDPIFKNSQLRLGNMSTLVK
jgi:pyruvate-formate lyase-activating enzyme